MSNSDIADAAAQTYAEPFAQGAPFRVTARFFLPGDDRIHQQRTWITPGYSDFHQVPAMLAIPRGIEPDAVQLVSIT